MAPATPTVAMPSQPLRRHQAINLYKQASPSQTCVQVCIESLTLAGSPVAAPAPRSRLVGSELSELLKEVSSDHLAVLIQTTASLSASEAPSEVRSAAPPRELKVEVRTLTLAAAENLSLTDSQEIDQKLALGEHVRKGEFVPRSCSSRTTPGSLLVASLGPSRDARLDFLGKVQAPEEVLPTLRRDVGPRSIFHRLPGPTFRPALPPTVSIISSTWLIGPGPRRVRARAGSESLARSPTSQHQVVVASSADSRRMLLNDSRSPST